nr:MAG TPA: hypothetical protein [Caudoviricetes sp.]
MTKRKQKELEEAQKKSSKCFSRDNVEKVNDAVKGVSLVAGLLSSALALGMYVDDHKK